MAPKKFGRSVAAFRADAKTGLAVSLAGLKNNRLLIVDVQFCGASHKEVGTLSMANWWHHFVTTSVFRPSGINLFFSKSQSSKTITLKMS